MDFILSFFTLLTFISFEFLYAYCYYQSIDLSIYSSRFGLYDKPIIFIKFS
jgi:hypothetical protein